MFKVIRSRNELIPFRSTINKTVGLVPTMGNLHAGHLSLIEKSLTENQVTICTIFVNPKQFAPNEDLDKYPRTQELDIEKLEDSLNTLSLEKDLIVFIPDSNDEIYPHGYDTTIQVGKTLTEKLCGISRPQHFAGVTTVVYTFFALTKPHRAYFGQKDYQQFKIIEKMTTDLLLPIELICMPIVREKDGLALSSRNQYLNADQRKEAITLATKINEIEKIWKKREDWQKKRDEILRDSRFEYLEILNADDLARETSHSSKVVIAGAFSLGQTRLIDNILCKR